jgi:hypothetical protein
MRVKQSRSRAVSSTAGAVVLIVIILIAAVVLIDGAGLLKGSTTTSTTTPPATTSTQSTTTTSKQTGSETSLIRVGSQYSNGSPVVGVYTELEWNDTEVAVGYTPVSFNVTVGQTYTVTVSDSHNLYFNEWSNGWSVRVIPVVASSTQQSVTAVYTTTPQPPPSTPYSISVGSNDLNGTTLTGFPMQIWIGGYLIQNGSTPYTFTNLEPGLQYQVVAYWGGNYYFRHFSNNELNRWDLVTLNSTGSATVSLDALYQYVPPSKAVTLNVIAEFVNGTVIGTTTNSASYIQTTPGVWFTVAPPGSYANNPYTGAFTGGSQLPFVLQSGENYTILMSNYHSFTFSRWQDTGSTDPYRSLVLDQNTTLVAIYEDT